jgi:uncharacterized protein (TIGR00297 family)
MDFGLRLSALAGLAHPRQMALGLVLAAAISAAAYATQALSAGGAVAAALVGAAVFGLGGGTWAAVLVAFFASSSLLSRWMSAAKWDAAADFAKGGRRDAMQVMANGVVGGILALVYGVSGDPALLAGFVGAVAAATADTWATEVGLLSGVPPRLVTTGQPVQPGTSGAVTPLGSAAAAAGGIFIGLVALLASLATRWGAGSAVSLDGVRMLLIAPTAGLAGAVVDSWLGATVQGVRRCPRCEKETERDVHTCGTPTRLARGWGWLSNDLVNLAATVVGAFVALAIEVLLFA